MTSLVSVIPVSYTHLDVYKRQDTIWPKNVIDDCINSHFSKFNEMQACWNFSKIVGKLIICCNVRNDQYVINNMKQHGVKFYFWTKCNFQTFLQWLLSLCLNQKVLPYSGSIYFYTKCSIFSISFWNGNLSKTGG